MTSGPYRPGTPAAAEWAAARAANRVLAPHRVVAVRVHPHTRYWMHQHDNPYTDEPGIPQLKQLAFSNGPDTVDVIVDPAVPVHVFRLVDDEGWTRDEVRATRYVVFRPAPGVPASFLPESVEGRWEDVHAIPGPGKVYALGERVGTATGRATGRFEMRDTDGALAEVYEVGP